MSASEMREVRLYGALGKRFGKSHKFCVASTAEAIRALCANFRDFERFVVANDKKKIGYRIVVDGDALSDESQIGFPVRRGGIIKIIPTVQGRKSGFGQIIMGIVMIVAAYFTMGATLIAAEAGSAAAGMAGSMMMSIGVSMIIGGVIQMLSPSPKSQSAKEDSNPSYLFDGAVNTMAQGHPVPVGYGRMIVGSAVISAGITVEEIAVTPGTTSGAPQPSGPAPSVVFNQTLYRFESPDGTPVNYPGNIGDESMGGISTFDGKAVQQVGGVWAAIGATMFCVWDGAFSHFRMISPPSATTNSGAVVTLVGDRWVVGDVNYQNEV